MEYKTLNNGVLMPILGYGTFQIPSSLAEQCVRSAFQNGYRLIDTAAAHFNEKEIGQAIKKADITRDQLFIATKVWVQDTGYENTLKAFEQSLQNLGLDYIDLYMIHQPYGDYYGSWKAMEQLYRQGRIRALGVCNFCMERFVDLFMNVSIKPMVNQIECHPFFQQRSMREMLKEYGCVMQAWGPLNEGQRNIFDHPALKNIAQKHERSVAQIVLRWHIQNQVCVIPKTIHPERMIENQAVFDFELDEEDLKQIASLDIGYSEIIDHQCYATAKIMNKCKIHD